jgi:hypothetical protein
VFQSVQPRSHRFRRRHVCCVCLRCVFDNRGYAVDQISTSTSRRQSSHRRHWGGACAGTGLQVYGFPHPTGQRLILAILLNNISTVTTRSYPTVWLPVPNPTLSAEPVAGPSEPEPVPTEDLDSNRGYVPFALESGPGAAAKVLQEDDSIRANHAEEDYKL